MIIRIAQGILDDLKGQPLAVALIIINMVYIGAGIWVWRASHETRTQLVSTVLKGCLDLENKRGFTWSPSPGGRSSGEGIGPGFK